MNNEDFKVVLSDKEYIKKLEKEVHYQNKEVTRLNNITKNKDRKIKLAIKIFENINKIYGESPSINDVIDVLKEE